MASVSSMSICRLSETYSPLRSLITPGTRTKSTRERKSKLPMIGEPDRMSTDKDGVGIDQRMRDRPAAAQMAKTEGVMAVDQDALMVATVAHAIPPSLSGRPHYAMGV